MAQKVHPTALRLGIKQLWNSTYKTQNSFKNLLGFNNNLLKDIYIRKLIIGFFKSFKYLTSEPIFHFKCAYPYEASTSLHTSTHTHPHIENLLSSEAHIQSNFSKKLASRRSARKANLDALCALRAQNAIKGAQSDTKRKMHSVLTISLLIYSPNNYYKNDYYYTNSAYISTLQSLISNEQDKKDVLVPRMAEGGASRILRNRFVKNNYENAWSARIYADGAVTEPQSVLLGSEELKNQIIKKNLYYFPLFFLSLQTQNKRAARTQIQQSREARFMPEGDALRKSRKYQEQLFEIIQSLSYKSFSNIKNFFKEIKQIQQIKLKLPNKSFIEMSISHLCAKRDYNQLNDSFVVMYERDINQIYNLYLYTFFNPQKTRLTSYLISFMPEGTPPYGGRNAQRRAQKRIIYENLKKNYLNLKNTQFYYHSSNFLGSLRYFSGSYQDSWYLRSLFYLKQILNKFRRDASRLCPETNNKKQRSIVQNEFTTLWLTASRTERLLKDSRRDVSKQTAVPLCAKARLFKNSPRRGGALHPHLQQYILRESAMRISIQKAPREGDQKKIEEWIQEKVNNTIINVQRIVLFKLLHKMRP